MDRFSKVDKNVDRFGYWIGAITIMTGAFSWIAKQMETYHLGWPEAFFIGLLAAGFVVLIVSAGLIGWRFFNPIGGVELIPSGDSVADPSRVITDDQVNTLVELRIAALLAETLPARFETHTQAHARDEKLAALADKVKFVRDIAEGSQSYAEKRFGDVGIDIRSLEEQAAQLRRDFDAWGHAHNRDQDQRFKFVDGGFRALGDRAKLTKIAERIEAGAGWLLQTSEGKKLDWMRFDLKREKWREEIASYGVIASHYLSDVPNLISAVPAEKLTGQWPEDRDLFPNDDAMLAHRTVAVTLRNFREQHERVMACVNSFAFDRPSMKGIPEG